MRLWRLTRYPDLSGRGGLQASARWHTRGRPVLYAASEPPGCLIEVLVHLDVQPEELPSGYRLVGIDVPDAIVPTQPARLRRDWYRQVPSTRAKGDAWLEGGVSLLLKVPSAIIGQTWNYLVNPAHAQMALVDVAFDQPYTFDPRIL